MWSMPFCGFTTSTCRIDSITSTPVFTPVHATHVDNDLSVTHVPMDTSEELILDPMLRSWTSPSPTDHAPTLTSIPMSKDDFDDSFLDYPPPHRPDALFESSIADLDPVYVSVEVDTVTTYQVVMETSTQGKDKAFDANGYSYTLKCRTLYINLYNYTYLSEMPHSQTIGCKLWKVMMGLIVKSDRCTPNYKQTPDVRPYIYKRYSRKALHIIKSIHNINHTNAVWINIWICYWHMWKVTF